MFGILHFFAHGLKFSGIIGAKYLFRSRFSCFSNLDGYVVTMEVWRRRVFGDNGCLAGGLAGGMGLKIVGGVCSASPDLVDGGDVRQRGIGWSLDFHRVGNLLSAYGLTRSSIGWIFPHLQISGVLEHSPTDGVGLFSGCGWEPVDACF